ncbi:MAG: hypothetical protein JXA90_09020 [Planctomycetes bacterium]|nr:hypothetical protein [Planctomycetota bacterium]
MAELTNVLNEYAHTLYTKLKDSIPTDVTLVEELSFDGENKQGGDYTEHVVVAEEAGFVHGSASDGAITAPTAVGMETVKATVNGFQIGIVSTIDYSSAERASGSRRAYADIAGKKQASGFNAIRKRVEDELWHGQGGLGKIASSANVDATHTVLTIKLSEYAPWIWAGKKNYQMVAYNATTRVGTGAFTITKTVVNRATRTVTVSGASGDISALDTAVAGAADTLDLYWSGTATGTLGASGFKTMVGLMKAATTTTGTLFNVDLDANSDAAPNTYAAGGALSFTKVCEAVELLIGRGVVEPIRADLNPRTWNNIMQDQNALRRYGAEVKKLESGADYIAFNIQRVPVEIVGEGRMKEGYGCLRPKSGLKRIGARDISMATPGSAGRSKGDIWYHDPSRFGYSWRIWTEQAFFTEELWKLLSITGIVNT